LLMGRMLKSTIQHRGTRFMIMPNLAYSAMGNYSYMQDV